MREKVKLTANILFSGIGCQERGFQNSGLFDIEVLNTSDINKESVLSYAAIHCDMTNEMVETYIEYPSREEMAQYLTDINLGYEPEKKKGKKEFDWFKLIKRKNKVLEKYWLACKLTHNLGDITRIDDLPYADFWTVSFPCFVEGTLVFTNDGYKPIEKVEIGDVVLTHANNWEKVTNTMINETNKLFKIKTMPSETIHCTANHPFYVRRKNKLQDNNTGKRRREFDKPEWVKAKDLTRDYYVGTAINQKSELPKWDGIEKKVGSSAFGQKTYIENRLEKQFIMNEFWYVIGRYLRDGWIRNQGGIIICANNQELYQIVPYLNKLEWHYNIVEEKTIYKIHIPFKEIGEYCVRFGRGASNKHLTSDILNLPVELLKSFIEGYIGSDGTQAANGLFKISSVSRELVYELGECVTKAYHRPCSIYFTNRPKTTVIEGRIVNQKDTYTICFKLDNNIQDKAFYEDGHIWSPINDIIEEKYDGLVYNLEVENDNSYMVQNVIVHNCQSISVAGKMKGLKSDSGTRSSLLWDNIRLLSKAKDNGTLPKYIMFENVKNLVGKKFINDFNDLLDVLDELGFNSYWSVINGKNCGVPQSRERVFVISIRKDIDNGKYTFPEPFDAGIRLKDILEDHVDEKYYLPDEKVQGFLKTIDLTQFYKNDNELNQLGYINDYNGDANRVYSDEIAKTLKSEAGGGGAKTGWYVTQNEILKVGQINSSQDGIVVSPDGVSKTHTAGHNNMPKIFCGIDKSINEPQILENANCLTAREDRGVSNRRAEGTAVLETPDISYCLDANYWKGTTLKQYRDKKRRQLIFEKISQLIRIRKLTPRECYKLMGLEFEDCDKAAELGVANTHLYKQAGNGIITNCCELLAEHLYKAQYDNTYVCIDERYNENFTKPQAE